MADTQSFSEQPSLPPLTAPILRTLTQGVPDNMKIDAPIPEARAVTEDRLKDFDLGNVSHVVVQQEQVFRYIGYEFDSNWPTPYWMFLGKITAKAIYDDPAVLLLLNFVRVRTREFIGFTAAKWAEIAKARRRSGTIEQLGLPPLNVIEVDIKRPQPGKPLEVFWKPARGVITERIRSWNKELDRKDLSRATT
ncbi:Uncharacterized protein TPAR_05991 [Tolypocladium paradoxum]|uniref:Uncharacterized protein n=1 Tax=Tolypocladium paradoxum TaxID=94208 RepID=A0A2S4KUC2_9HYPO|nr:Uncharacterized protein TPAR_05991 [Tolypocladium paradoxum]